MKTTTLHNLYEIVKVLVWERSHSTGNGNGVYKFTVETPSGEVITGKTQPGMHQHLRSNPVSLINVAIDTTPTGRVIMKYATNP